VCLHGERIGTLSPVEGDEYELAYASELVEQLGPGTPLLSNSLPVRAEPYSPRASRAYVEGLLPEGRQRARIGRQLGVDPRDGFALISELGRDCPGAVTFGSPEEAVVAEGAEPVPGHPSSTWLGDDELAELLSPAPGRLPRAASRRCLRSTLGGNRHKVSLVGGGPDGRWGRPSRELPSTHVLKPETSEYSELVPNEMFCMAVLRQAGLPAAKTSVQTIAGHTCLVSPRFDLTWDGGMARRIHQETFCQALGIATGGPAGSEEANAPGFAEATGLLRAIGRKADVSTLVQAAFCNYVLGNGAAHGRNFALLFRGDGIRLAPLYDVTSTIADDDPAEAGMVLPDDYDPATYLRGLSRVAEECGIEIEVFHIQATCTLAHVCDAIEIVAERAEDDGWYAPVIDRIFELAQERASHCAERLSLWDHLDM
jgi:serine/threonine-protein kinase HipA